MPSSVRARRSSAPTSSTAAATRRWGAPGRTSTSPPSAAKRSGRTHRRATRRPRPTGGGTTTTPTARKPDRDRHEIGDPFSRLPRTSRTELLAHNGHPERRLAAALGRTYRRVPSGPAAGQPRCRVAQAHCCTWAPSEPSVRRSPHSAQASSMASLYTRLTGRGRSGRRPWTRSTSSAFAEGVTTTSPSAPGVRRPALCSVTRRTLASVFARLRSINFCRLRTLGRSPACDAVKILWRSRRTLFSAATQSMASQSKTSPPGPFTGPASAAAAAPSMAVSNLSGSSVVVVIASLHKLTRPTSAPFRVRAPRSYPASYTQPGRRRSRPSPLVSFPVAFRPPAFASWVILRPPGDWAFLTVGLPAHPAWTLTGLSRSTRSRYDRGGCPLYPEAHGVLWPQYRPPASVPLPSGRPFTRTQHSHRRAQSYEASTGVHSRSPVQSSPSPVTPGWAGRPWA